MPDPLTAILSSLRLAGSITCYSQLKSPWGIVVRPTRGALFHLIESGTCWVTPDQGRPPVRLSSGDLILFPRGHAHVLADQPDRTPLPAERLVPSHRLGQGQLRGGGKGPRTDFICGEFHVDFEGRHPFWSQLPPFLHLPGARTRRSQNGLRTTLRQLAAEVKHPRPGSGLVVTRLLDVLVVEIVRAWLARQPEASGWLGGMRDGKIATALGLMHERPEHDWTVASLAATVGVSRTVFAERFAGLVGESPLHYLTRVRMQRAAVRLRSDGAATMIAVAEEAGYGSEAAFGKAFKRILGVSPGNYRRTGGELAA
jgi:AraC-like DNA-binding protein